MRDIGASGCSCAANAPSPAQGALGLHTLNLSASTALVPDIIAVNATSDPDYVDVSPATHVDDFVVAISNLGTAARMTASVETALGRFGGSIVALRTTGAGRRAVNGH
jgi:hypothetical protein